MTRDRTRLDQNFFRYEFACRCGCGGQTVDAELVQVLQRVRNHYDRPITISSGFRCRAHNVASDGYPKSRHLRGEAADFTVDGWAAQEVQTLLRRWFPDKYGIGRSNMFTHLDVRPRAANWGY